jgi:hypothetical protein
MVTLLLLGGFMKKFNKRLLLNARYDPDYYDPEEVSYFAAVISNVHYHSKRNYFVYSFLFNNMCHETPYDKFIQGKFINQAIVLFYEKI